jgi:hypothetical protein
MSQRGLVAVLRQSVRGMATYERGLNILITSIIDISLCHHVCSGHYCSYAAITLSRCCRDIAIGLIPASFNFVLAS